MPMDLSNPNTWFSHLLENLPEEKLAAAIGDDNPDWEFIDGEIVKLGSLAHNQLDIQELQRRALTLLSSESKDFRLLAHLLRTLQHAGDVQLALPLLAQYVENFWAIAWPQNMTHKKRFATQVLKRFEPAASLFAQRSSPEQREQLLGEMARLAQLWQGHNAPELAQAADDVFALYQREFRSCESAHLPELPTPPTVTKLATTAPAPKENVPLPPQAVDVDSHSDKAWRETLLKVADILCERQPGSPLGYRLRRHALWQSISSAPQAESDGRTPLAAFSADLLDDYLTRARTADMPLWQQVEKSLLLAPYWFDGHALSARIAQQLGYENVAEAIRDEVAQFVSRLPELCDLRFNDQTPFIAEATRQWLTPPTSSAQPSQGLQTEEDVQSVWQCFKENGLEAALSLLEQQPDNSPRARFYREWQAAQLLESAGMNKLAHQHYCTLHQTAQQIMLVDWEPALMAQLEEKINK